MTVINQLRDKLYRRESKAHELELLLDDDSVLAASWRELQRHKAKINGEKLAALRQIDECNAEKLTMLEQRYALVLKLAQS